MKLVGIYVFSPRFIGGGVLNYGSVQEEIRFLICPELLLSQLFSQQMLSTEAIVITGKTMGAYLFTH